MENNFDHLRRTWNHLGETDPLWAVLSDPRKRGNQWDLESFFAEGRREIDEVLQKTAARLPDLPRACALDFGCGVGRLTRALAAHFGRVIGVDVAASMIRQARQLNADRPNCEFLLNERADLGLIASGSVDFLYCALVLPHIEPPYAETYVREFVRVLSPRGIAAFQSLDRPGNTLTGVLSRLIPGPILELYRHIRYGRQRIKIHALPKERVHAAVKAAGGQVVHEEDLTGSGGRWVSKLYFVRRLTVA